MTGFQHFYILPTAKTRRDPVPPRQGVSVDALVEPELPAFSEVTFNDGHTFDFAEEGGDGAIIFLARDEEGDPCDLVAWSPRRSR